MAFIMLISMLLLVALLLQSMKEVLRDFQSKGKKVLLLNWRPRAKHGFVKFDGRDENIFIPNTSQLTMEDDFKSRSSVY
jgi:hypothetical protein